MTPFSLTRSQLLLDLHQAYLDARRHKRSKPYQRLFEARLDANLDVLCDELWTRTYRPRPSVCFLICDPKRREVFAADFRDRIVHHLYYNYVHEMLERTSFRIATRASKDVVRTTASTALRSTYVRRVRTTRSNATC